MTRTICKLCGKKIEEAGGSPYANAAVAIADKGAPPDVDAQERAANRYHYLASILGYNEAVRRAPTLGEKLYARMAREHFVKLFVEAGGRIETKNDAGDVVLEAPADRPHLKLYEADIELMRAAIVKWDADHARRRSAPIDAHCCEAKHGPGPCLMSHVEQRCDCDCDRCRVPDPEGP